MVCGVTFFERPALIACCFTILSTDRRSKKPKFLAVFSLKFFASTGTNSASLISLRALRYSRIHFLAFSDRNTTLTLPPFPRTESSSEFRLISDLRAQSSETRRPVEKKKSKKKFFFKYY